MPSLPLGIILLNNQFHPHYTISHISVFEHVRHHIICYGTRFITHWPGQALNPRSTTTQQVQRLEPCKYIAARQQSAPNLQIILPNSCIVTECLAQFYPCWRLLLTLTCLLYLTTWPLIPRHYSSTPASSTHCNRQSHIA